MNLPSIDRFKEMKTTLNERQTLVKKFLDKINSEREGYPPVEARRMGIMLAPIKTKDLYSFYADCSYASHFSKYFWSRFKK